ncbi:ATP-grasp domain-containing protein [Streptomyces alkaliterrae]|uniref:Biotin carboxylase n=1 Tax=Streptomyces alkaliterrae TaxID=2213162 RepID=A0A5P0YUH7_9ACTN|nr:biotin carboxylase [Streptomyces alkaliterrae]MBB1252648.1 biotin carboxylase [Streptomyces alkaliterrae]MBB1257987.1 biotin carboxylase [Streptomyces alkaliterrae]MQS03961.1 biotin carboxylase [Streptomyces alkaliterrae]
MTALVSHVLVIHRWRDHYARYADYLDHRHHQVTYVTTALGLESVPVSAAGTVTVSATDDIGEVRQAVDTLTVRFGRPQRVIALNEGDLEVAAQLRAELGCPGQGTTELARFRDKLTMVQTVALAGLPTPAFADAPDAAAVKEFAQTHGWPVVVKPRRGTASRGVLRLDSPEDLAALESAEPEDRIVQTFCADAVYHVDGLWTGRELGPWRASRYLNTCAEFSTGTTPLGSVEEDDPELLRHIGGFTTAVAGALGGRRPWVFHLEVFVGADEDGGTRLTFLEAGWRVGGAEIPFVWREVHGLDLMSAAVAIQLGETPELAEPAATRRIGGWLLVPAPLPSPCRVVGVRTPATPPPSLYARVVPQTGYVLPRIGGYEHVGARFRFRGGTTAEVADSILATAAEVSLDCVPAPPPDRRAVACGLDR